VLCVAVVGRSWCSGKSLIRLTDARPLRAVTGSGGMGRMARSRALAGPLAPRGARSSITALTSALPTSLPTPGMPMGRGRSGCTPPSSAKVHRPWTGGGSPTCVGDALPLRMSGEMVRCGPWRHSGAKTSRRLPPPSVISYFRLYDSSLRRSAAVRQGVSDAVRWLDMVVGPRSPLNALPAPAKD
jgi:hypothetical protein